MGDFNMYHPIKFRIEYNSFGKIVNNLIYMYARDMILHSFERANWVLLNSQNSH
jgi:hypothetical protein